MGININQIYRSASFNVNEELKDDIIKENCEKLNEKYSADSELNNVIITTDGNRKIKLLSKDSLRITEAVKEACTIFNNKLVDTIAYTIMVTISIEKDEEDGKDAYDIMDNICSTKIKNSDAVISVSSRFALIYKRKDYFVEMTADRLTKMFILVEKRFDMAQLNDIYDELIEVYYSTLHVSINI